MTDRRMIGWLPALAAAVVLAAGVPGAPGPLGPAEAQAAGKGQGKGNVRVERRGGGKGVGLSEDSRGPSFKGSDQRLEHSRRPGGDDDERRGHRFGLGDAADRPGQGALRSDMKGLNAARGGEMKFRKAAGGSQVGKIELYRQAEDGDAAARLEEAAGGPVTRQVADEMDRLMRAPD